VSSLSNVYAFFPKRHRPLPERLGTIGEFVNDPPHFGIDPWRRRAPSTRTFESNPGQELMVDIEAIAGLRDPDVAGE
jgi:hypothetical protein